MPAKKISTKVSTKASDFLGLPKTLAGCADLLYTTREQRLALNKEADGYKKLETQLSNHLIDALPVGEASGIVGKIAGVLIDTKPVATVDDWDTIYCYIVYGPKTYKAKLQAHKVKSDPAVVRFALLNRAISQSTVKEMWDAGEVVPGVSRMNVKIVSVTKRKAKG